MKRLAILLLLFASIASAATPTLRKAQQAPRPRVADGATYYFTEPGWELGSHAEISGTYGYVSSPVALVLSHDGLDGSYGRRRLFPAKIGVPYAMSVLVNGDRSGDNSPLLVFVYTDEASPLLVWQSIPATMDGWVRVDLGTFVNPRFDPESLHVGAMVFPASLNFNRWVIGQIEFREIESPGFE